MSLGHEIGDLRSTRFPRVSGDEPRPDRVCVLDEQFSPRERG